MAYAKAEASGSAWLCSVFAHRRLSLVVALTTTDYTHHSTVLSTFSTPSRKFDEKPFVIINHGVANS